MNSKIAPVEVIFGMFSPSVVIHRGNFPFFTVVNRAMQRRMTILIGCLHGELFRYISATADASRLTGIHQLLAIKFCEAKMN